MTDLKKRQDLMNNTHSKIQFYIILIDFFVSMKLKILHTGEPGWRAEGRQGGVIHL